MKKNQIVLSAIIIFTLIIITVISYGYTENDPKLSTYNQYISADHNIVNQIRLNQISDSKIELAKEKLRIAYGHTSHGSQLTTGMSGLPEFKEANGGTEGLYDWKDVSNWDNVEEEVLNIADRFTSEANDLGNPNREQWATATRNYLNNPSNTVVNVVIWSWCGQVSSASEEDINTYLSLMNSLENDYPEVIFVYMTGHVDGNGEEGNLYIRNGQIRDYCEQNKKILYDFADIESYDPDGNYYGDKAVNDNCDYDSDGNGSRDSNWALNWQNAHTESVDYYSCSAAHSQALNGNLKAYAAWWLWVHLAELVEYGHTDDGDSSSSLFESIPGFDVSLVVCSTFLVIAIVTFVKKFKM